MPRRTLVLRGVLRLVLVLFPPAPCRGLCGDVGLHLLSGTARVVLVHLWRLKGSSRFLTSAFWRSLGVT